MAGLPPADRPFYARRSGVGAGPAPIGLHLWSNADGRGGGIGVCRPGLPGSAHQDRALWANRRRRYSMSDMNETSLRLDGNAAAGVLGEIFAVEMTSARCTCAHCGHVAPLGSLVLYGG